ncbi:polysaccharide deacetylase family protein [Paenibacillus guangzhouensis]|uniref:polysaccharide deacetylase family protein n=1 Tax=Paenibacillus guangzhouensis TaxID=1473112 RepID=UPI001266E2D2|nr:polysaccharide deacetylase family protein [Paenibacillus guangzhouensis]
MANVQLTFPEGKHKVLTMSYDDGRSADRRLVRTLNQHGIRGTFHLNSGLAGHHDRIPLEEVKNLYQGHEIAAHSVTHPTLTRCTREQIVGELMEDRKSLERISGYPVRGFSYPNGTFNRQMQEILPHLGIAYARTVLSHGDFQMPDDYFAWHPTCHHNQNLLELTEAFKQLGRRQHLHMLYVWGHSYEFDHDNNWDVIERFCESVSGRDDIWYATNIEIVDYLRRYQSLRFSAGMDLVYNPSYHSIWLEANGEVIEVKGGSQIELVK